MNEEEEKMNLSQITWENTGIKILADDNKYLLSRHEKQLLKVLLFKYRPPINLRKKVKKYFYISYGY